MIGNRISAYEIVAELGSGGMGKVYRAEVRGRAAGLKMGTAVALKVVFPHLMETPGFFKRFLREAQIGQQVQHENVVRTFDCDATLHDGVQQNFLVMEYVEGQTLRDLFKELERVPEELCRHAGREIAKGLAAIHEVGAVHRDIKPENVLITEDHVVKVMDLGVAHLTEDVIRLSQTGMFVGSVEYAAPEQFNFEQPTDHRADLHALGVLLYELSTGQHPYRDADVHKLLRNIIDKSPRRPGDINTQLSPFFEEVINTLLAKNRDDRFADAALVAQVLEEGEESPWWVEKAKVLRVETKRPLRRIRVPRETALYGRDDDLETLHGLFDKAKDGDGQVLLVEGEAGIGKTRLVDEFVGRLRQEGEEINFLFGSYPPGGAATSSGAFSEAYRKQFGDAGLETSLGEYLTTTPLLIPAFAALLRGDATPMGAEPLTKDSLQTVFVHATRGLAAERPTIVLIDDLHFAPESGRALFASLAMAVPGHRVLLVGTSRPGIAKEWVSNLERAGNFGILELLRLGPKDLVALLEDSFRSERLARQLAAQVGVKSDGNPFFAFEIIRGMREANSITQSVDGTWISTQRIQNIEIPSSLLDLIQARLRELSDEDKDLLDVASCCGFEFDPGLVAQAIGMPRLPALKRMGRIEQAHRLIRSAGRSYVFDHHQVQESLYSHLHEQMREEYHAAIGEALETREKAAERDPKDLGGELCVDLCEHFLKGARGESARRYLHVALGHLEAGYLNDQMLALADRALEAEHLLQGPARVDVLLQKGARLGHLGRTELQRAALAEARTLAEEEGETSSLAGVEFATGQSLSQTGQYEEARAHYERARTLFQALGDHKGEADAIDGLGAALLSLGRYEDSAVQHRRALAIRREIGDKRGEAASTGNLGNVSLGLGRLDDSRAQFERANRLGRECGNRLFEAVATGSLGNVFFVQGRFEEARAQLQRALEIAREIGARASALIQTGNLGYATLCLGRSAEGLGLQVRALAMARETGDRSGEALALSNLGGALARLGASAEAESRQRGVLDIAREIGFRWLEAFTLAALAVGSEEQGDLVAAEELHKEALAHYDAMATRDDSAASAHLQYGVLLSRLDRPDEARAHFSEALAMATEAGAPSVRLLSLIRLSALDGSDPSEAVEALRNEATRLKHRSRMEANLLLYDATGDRQHLDTAHSLLTYWVEHAPEEHRKATLSNVRVHRDIMNAWSADHSDR